ncbi:hypothetical protein, partial [Pseudofulvimonas gallinarii]|uniref:hypothetical protein n=1 Tax=Pseudofulvimonas gallinarii TaxID=634155 RepID=UPI00197F4F83
AADARRTAGAAGGTLNRRPLDAGCQLSPGPDSQSMSPADPPPVMSLPAPIFRIPDQATERERA